MTYSAARKSIEMLRACPDNQLQRIREKSNAYIANRNDKHDARVNRTIQHECRERGI